jgi:hypothetical protein
MEITKKTPGQTLVEFALLLPLLLILVMAFFDIGRAVVYYAVLNTAVREGTRFAIVQSGCGFKADPDKCEGDFLEIYKEPMNCDVAIANNNANKAICEEVQSKLFNIGELSNNIIVVQHLESITYGHKEYYIKIDITHNYQPVTPGLGLIGTFPIEVNSQMLKTPIARP